MFDRTVEPDPRPAAPQSRANYRMRDGHRREYAANRDRGSTSFPERCARGLADIGVYGAVSYRDLAEARFGGHPYTTRRAVNAWVRDGLVTETRATIWDLHLDYKIAGLDLRALVAGATVDDVAELNALRGLTGASSIGEELGGWYVQAGYDVLRGVETAHQLIPYLRYEAVNTQKEVPEGFAVNPANERTVLTLGGAWKPIPEAVLKVDYNKHSNEAETGVSQLSVALGWLF